MSTPQVFISYSTRDHEFVRALAATLEIAGVDVLRDETGVMVGDSIPDWIYASLDSATDVIYVLSEHALASSWVREELSVAKMRQKRDAGFGIRPVLIDDTALPISMAHIRYADFRRWQSPETFRSAALLLLKALGVESPTVDASETEWWLRASPVASVVRDRLHRVGAGAWVAAKCAEDDRATIKYGARLLWDDLVSGLARLDSLAADYRPQSERLGKIRTEIADVRRTYTRIHDSESADDARSAARGFESATSLLAEELADVGNAALSVLAAAVRPQEQLQQDAR